MFPNYFISDWSSVAPIPLVVVVVEVVVDLGIMVAWGKVGGFPHLLRSRTVLICKPLLRIWDSTQTHVWLTF